MTDVGGIVLKGLTEGLVLLAIEREPTHGYGILKDFEDVFGEAPNKNQIYPLLQRMEEDGLIYAEEVQGDGRSKQVYHLTEEGQARLDEFRAISPSLKNRLVDLFGIPAPDELAHELEQAGRLGELEAMEARSRRPPTPRAGPIGAGWVAQRLDELPRGPRVQAPYAEFSLNRNPQSDAWVLEVRRHAPGDYEGSQACPLTFLYLAVQRLLFEQQG